MPNNKHITFDAAPSARSIDANGYMHVNNSHITKAQVVPYWGREVPGWEEHGLNPSRLYYAYRDPVELEKSVSTWNGLPLHIEHHVDSADEPQKLTRVGAMGTGSTWNPPYIDNALVVWDKEAQQGINDGSFREISCAYRYTPDFTPGEADGIPYDFVMRNIEGNHVALVESGRAGRDVVVADSKLETGDDGVDVIKPPIEGAPKGGSPRLAAIIDELSQVKEAIEQKEADALDALAEKIGQKEGKEMNEEVIQKDAVAAAPEDEEEKIEVVEAAETSEDALPPTPEKKEEAPADNEEAKMDAFIESLTPEIAAKLAEKLAAKMAKAKDAAPAAMPAMDADSIRADLLKDFRERSAAARAVRNLCGDLDPMAFDSAASIYGQALGMMGIDVKRHSADSYRSMFEAAMSQRGRTNMSMAMDRGPVEYTGAFAGLSKIKIGE